MRGSPALPGDAENPSEATQVEGVDSFDFGGSRRSRSRYLLVHLGADGQHRVVPDPLSQTC